MTQGIIAGDVGGTKTLLALASCEAGRCEIREERRYENRDFADFGAMLADFLAGHGNAPAAACFAVAAPVAGRSIRLTNLDWTIDADAIARGFAIPRVGLVNDFEAVALGVEALGEHDVETLQAGRLVEAAPRVVLGAGTGMGVAWLVRSGERHLPVSTEAGHTDFAPQGEVQIRLLRHLAGKFGHVSWERLLSGSGLIEIFRFLDEELSDSPLGLGTMEPGEDEAARIADLALRHLNPTAEQALDLFVQLYGAFAGNLALAGLTRGGVYVAGGIAPKILAKLKDGRFIEAFRDKGRFTPLMVEMPVMVVTNARIGLLGAILAAARA